jgi:hypothetical protein
VKEERQAIGRILRDKSIADSIPLRKMAELTGLSHMTILRAFTGKVINTNSLLHLCETLGLEVIIRERR